MTATAEVFFMLHRKTKKRKRRRKILHRPRSVAWELIPIS